MLLPEEHHEVGDAGIVAELHEQRRRLAAVMGLVVEEVRDRHPERVLARAAGHAAVADRAGEPLGVKPVDPGLDVAVGLDALAAQVVEVGVEHLIVHADPDRVAVAVAREADLRVLGEAPEPDAVGPEDVIQRAVQRAEEGAEIALALGVVERRGEA